jgi:hypothetical protein
MWNTSRENHQYYKVGFVTLILLLTTSSTLVVGEDSNGNRNITQTYLFDEPQIHRITVNGQVFDQITMRNAEGAWNVGEPDLPTYGVSLLLPQGTTVTKITVQPATSVVLGSGFNVAPVEQPVTLSDFSSISAKGLKNESIYSSENVFPPTLFTTVGIYSFRGYNILMLLLHPVQYYPMSGELSYFTEMTVTVITAQTGSVSPLFRGLDKDRIEVAKKVDNVDTLSSYTTHTTAPLSGDNYDLLILTTDALKDGFIPLKNTHDAQGLQTEIKTLSDISPFPGTVTSDTIRDFIRDEYISHGIDYVLIGGDSDIIPAKMLWVQANSDTDTMPSDLYYSCLDGTFNYNNNDKWGEPHDGNGGGDVDLVGEVYVGRATVGDLTETNIFIQKSIALMNTGGYSTGTALMVGEYLWGPPNNPVTFGDDYMEELINGSYANSYTTVGIPLNDYTFSRLYDHNWSGFDPNDPWNTGWPINEIISRINAGVHFINHLGHSSTNYNMRMRNEDVEGLTNNILPFIYSQGCYAGAFDSEDCIAESFTVKTTHAAFAVIMCARYGWGTPGSTNGPSQRYNRYFWNAVFGENITELGKANQDSKEKNLKRINSPCMRWCYYEMNLFGDPTLQLVVQNNTAPQKPTTPSGVSSGQIGQNYTFTSVTTDADGDLLYYQWSFGDGTFSTWLGPYMSSEQVNVSHNWSKRGHYEVKVKARDEHRSDSEWSDPLPIKMPFIPTFPFIERLFELLGRYFPRIYSLLNLK